MTSSRKISANRANALASTGPKSVRGKVRAAQNAHRHGLTISVMSDPECSQEVETFTREIVGEGASPEMLALARRFSEAQVDLVRIRKARYDILVRNLSNPDYFPRKHEAELDRLMKFLGRHLRRFGPEALCPPEISRAVSNIIENNVQGPEKFAHILSDFTKKLAAFDRYERRALSRRKFAIREFDTMRVQSARGAK
jgi:hypothetical protein